MLSFRFYRFVPFALLLAIFHLMVASVMAQAPAASAAPPSIRLRLLAFQPSHAMENVYVHDPLAAADAAGQKLPMRTYLNHESTTILLRSRRLILTTSADASSKKEQRLAEMELPEKTASAVLIALPMPEGSVRPYRLLAVPDSIQAFPAGTFHVINLSRSTVRIELEKKPWIIEPARTMQIKDPPVRHGNQSGMKAFVKEQENWRRVASGLWPHPGRERVIQLVYENPASHQVQIIAFDDVVPR